MTWSLLLVPQLWSLKNPGLSYTLPLMCLLTQGLLFGALTVDEKLVA